MWRKKEIADKVAEDIDGDTIPEIVFAPGCFDHFEGTQEELDALKAEIMEMFAGKTSKQLMAQTRLLSADDIMDMPEEVQQQIVDALNGVDTSRKLH
jgi:hypothetical protein